MTRDELVTAGFEVGPEAYARLSRFVELLLRENRRVNLTAVRDSGQVWRLHICESLALLPLVSRLQPRRVLDLGTGGGIPGIPLACVHDNLEVTLLDATRKKLDAVERIVSELALDGANTAWGRAETLAHDQTYRERFDVVTARAVAALPTLLEYAAGFVRVGGQCWFSKSLEAAEREIEAARRAANRCELKYVDTHRFELPGQAGERGAVVYAKRAPLSADLPRPPGRPRQKPL